jgi:uncharacterized protein (DUF2267 family)
VAELGPDRRLAWKVLSVVLHKLRDRLPVQLAAHLGAELPLLVRGVYYDQFEPEKQPLKCDLEEFTAEIAEWMADVRPVNPREAMRTVFGVLSRHVPAGQIAKVQQALPKDLRDFWLAAEESIVPPPEQGDIRRDEARR